MYTKEKVKACSRWLTVLLMLLLCNKKGNNITSRFSRAYSIEGGSKLTTTNDQGQTVDAKPVTWQDATTGTTLLERYGSVNIGSKTGTVTVKIAFTPTAARLKTILHSTSPRAKTLMATL